MAQNQIIFSTYCEDHLQERFGAHKLVNSFRYFHPYGEIILYGSKEINEVHKKYGVNYSNALPCIMLDIKQKYDSDYICHIDSDSLVLGWLKDIVTLDYDIASCLNNPDIGDRDERQNRPQQLWTLPNNKYVSCGCLSTNSEKFLHDWISLNRQIVENFGGIKEFWQCDQNMMNILFHYYNYKTKILDPLDGECFYGASANTWSTNTHNPDHIIKEWGINSWQSWYDIEYKNEQFFLHDKKVKILHQSGGGNKDTAIKCNLNMFNNDTKKILQEITGFNE
jgi:hypothetical protein